MKIICVGFWKTGTKSMSTALKLLGYQSIYDYEEQYLLLHGLWDKFFNGTVTDDDIHDALHDVDVLIDGPTVVFWEEIYRVFPEAKIILTNRDENCWWKNFKATNDKFFRKRIWRFALLLSPSGSRLGKYSHQICMTIVLNVLSIDSYAYGMEPFTTFTWKWNANARLYKLKYRMHRSHVVQTVTPESLLVHFCEDGWQPLCSFLGLPVPGTIEYPLSNRPYTLFHKESDASYLFRKVVRETVFSLCLLMLLIACGGWYAQEHGWLKGIHFYFHHLQLPKLHLPKLPF